MKKIILSLLITMNALAYCQTAAECLEAKLNKLHSFRANFSQIISSKGHELSRSAGTMALLRPGYFRWQTKEPLAQLIIADGQQLWIYEPELEQVTVKAQQINLTGAASLFLKARTADLSKDYQIKMTEAKGQTSFFLQARANKENFQGLAFIFRQDKLVGFAMDDQLGQHSKVELTKVELNPPLTKQLFQFSPPKGVDVIKQ